MDPAGVGVSTGIEPDASEVFRVACYVWFVVKQVIYKPLIRVWSLIIEPYE